jgi:hypothetical protein
MKIFISYSADDLNTVHKLAGQIKQLPEVSEVHYWDKSKKPGEDAWNSIFRWIDSSDVVIAVISDKTVDRGLSVGMEIGHAKKSGKKIIPLVADDVSGASLGCLSGLTYEKISKDNPVPTVDRLKNILGLSVKEVASSIGNLVLLVIVIGLIWLIFFKKKK